MSDTYVVQNNRGAYESPFSGVGVEFEPLGVTPDKTGLVLHEAGYLRANQGWNFPGVLSPFWRLYYNRQHGHTLWLHEQQIDLEPDVLVLIPDHQLFHCLGEQPVSSFWLQFSVAGRLSLDQALPVVLSPTAIELGIIDELSEGIEQGIPGDARNRIRSLSRALLHIVLSRSEIQWQEKIPERLEGLMLYIAGNVGVTLSNATLAQEAGVSVEVLIRLFKKHLGITPGIHVTQVRIRMASQLLLHTEDPIEEIALALGFPDRAYFSRVFKRVTGEPPAAYRRKSNC